MSQESTHSSVQSPSSSRHFVYKQLSGPNAEWEKNDILNLKIHATTSRQKPGKKLFKPTPENFNGCFVKGTVDKRFPKNTLITSAWQVGGLQVSHGCEHIPPEVA